VLRRRGCKTIFFKWI